jgi:hypothetical protein
MLAWYRRFPPKDDPDNGEMEKTKEADASMEAGGPDASDASEEEALQLPGNEDEA